jgi:hypothetical protein
MASRKSAALSLVKLQHSEINHTLPNRRIELSWWLYQIKFTHDDHHQPSKEKLKGSQKGHLLQTNQEKDSPEPTHHGPQLAGCIHTRQQIIPPA